MPVCEQVDAIQRERKPAQKEKLLRTLSQKGVSSRWRGAPACVDRAPLPPAPPLRVVWAPHSLGQHLLLNKKYMNK